MPRAQARSSGSESADEVYGPPCSSSPDAGLWYALQMVQTNLHCQERLLVRTLPPDAMVAGPLKRADEIGFQQSFNLIILLLVFRRELFIRDGLGAGS